MKDNQTFVLKIYYQETEKMEKTFANRKIIFRIHKEFLQLHNKKSKNKNWQDI